MGRKVKIRSLRFALIIGPGYWRQKTAPFSPYVGTIHNIVFLFIYIQIGNLYTAFTLENQLKIAISSENYEEADRLKKMIKKQNNI